jgi:hypothetical protein
MKTKGVIINRSVLYSLVGKLFIAILKKRPYKRDEVVQRTLKT